MALSVTLSMNEIKTGESKSQQRGPGMGEIEKVRDIESQNLGIKNYLRNTGIEKTGNGLVIISLFRMKKFEIFPMICF